MARSQSIAVVVISTNDKSRWAVLILLLPHAFAKRCSCRAAGYHRALCRGQAARRWLKHRSQCRRISAHCRGATVPNDPVELGRSTEAPSNSRSFPSGCLLLQRQSWSGRRDRTLDPNVAGLCHAGFRRSRTSPDRGPRRAGRSGLIELSAGQLRFWVKRYPQHYPDVRRSRKSRVAAA